MGKKETNQSGTGLGAEDVGEQDGQGDEDHAADGDDAEEVAVALLGVVRLAAEAQVVVAQQADARQRHHLSSSANPKHNNQSRTSSTKVYLVLPSFT